MKKIIEKIKPIAKIIGIVLGIFILWIIFGMITNKSSHQFSIQKGSLNSSRTFSDEMTLSENNIGSREMTDSDKSYNYNTGSNQAASPESITVEKKVIKNGDLTLKIENTEKAANEISAIAKGENGEVFSTNFYERTKGQKSGNIVIKVPVEKFEATIAQIKQVATQVISESTTGRDVTERYTDLQAQLKNKKAEEQSFIKILDRAGEIKDVLAVTQQVSRVRGEIERLSGQIRFMDSQTDMSTITVSLSEDIELTPVQNDWRPWQVTKKAFNNLINNLQDFVDGAIRFIVVGIPSLIPFLLFLGVIYWIGKKIWRKIRS